jgi:hypothetical protein
VIFGKDEVIRQHLAMEAAPLPARKTSVKAFDLPGMQCTEMGRILFNDILGCARENQQGGACPPEVKLSSRAGIELVR